MEYNPHTHNDPNKFNIDLMTLKANYGWSDRKIARAVGVSNVAVMGWFKGAEIREANLIKLRNAVEANRYVRKPAYTDFDGRKPDEERINSLTKLHRYGVPVEDISKFTGIPTRKLWRLICAPSEMRSEMLFKIQRYELTISQIHNKEIVTDLLDFLPF